MHAKKSRARHAEKFRKRAFRCTLTHVDRDNSQRFEIARMTFQTEHVDVLSLMSLHIKAVLRAVCEDLQWDRTKRRDATR
jgi:hypothetical protein